jgi:hypothetical protein
MGAVTLAAAVVVSTRWRLGISRATTTNATVTIIPRTSQLEREAGGDAGRSNDSADWPSVVRPHERFHETLPASMSAAGACRSLPIAGLPGDGSS